MQIIREGNLEQAKRRRENPKTFVCHDCGAVFTAISGEYECSQHDGYYCQCPCCKTRAFERLDISCSDKIADDIDVVYQSRDARAILINPFEMDKITKIIFE